MQVRSMFTQPYMLAGEPGGGLYSADMSVRPSGCNTLVVEVSDDDCGASVYKPRAQTSKCTNARQTL
jgi:hypothetical protein